MQIEEYARMHELEDEYWWFVARRHLIATLLSDLALNRPADIVDIGCGTGAMLDVLSEFGTVVGADYSSEALGYCARRGRSSGAHYRLCRADARHLPFRSGAIDIVTAMDIVEHIDDDKGAFREIARVLRPGGSLLATVPAYKSLWSDHDIALHHYRRYTAPGVRDLAQRAGLEVVRLSYTVSALLPIIFGYRLADGLVARLRRRDTKARRQPKASLVRLPPTANAALLALSRLETNMVRRTNLPFGATVVIVARRPSLNAGVGQ